MDIAVVMITVDRSPHMNYLAETLTNLYRSSPGLELTLIDSGPWETSGKWAAETVEPWAEWIQLNLPDKHRCANMNTASALRQGSEQGDWVLFLEDDIDVCNDFLNSVKSWLDIYASEEYRIYALGSVYSQRRPGSHRIPISGFFGTQAVALRSEDAVTLAQYMEDHCFDEDIDGGNGTGYDLLMYGWSAEYWPHLPYFLAACPSFVQHIGRESLINPRPVTHKFATWLGREWTWV